MAATGFFYSFRRKRTAGPMSMLKYDPIGMFHGLFTQTPYASPGSQALSSPAPYPPHPLMQLDSNHNITSGIAPILTQSLVRKHVLFLEQKRKGGK